MSTTQKIFAGIVTGLAVLGTLAFFGVSLAPQSRLAGAINNGAAVINYPEWFVIQGSTTGKVLYAGSQQQWSVDNSGNEVAASITDTGNATVSGNATITGTLTAQATVSSGNINATSTTVTSQTLVQADILGFTQLAITPNTGSLTLTLPASSTLNSFIPNAGNRYSVDVYDATSTTGVTIAIAGATGVQLEQSTSSPIKAGYFGRLEFTRLQNSNIDVLYLAGF